MVASKSAENHIVELSCTTDEGLGDRAKIGMVVLQTDQTIEHEFRSLLNHEGVALYHSRIPNEMDVTRETLAKMEADLPNAAALLPSSFNFDAVGYGCTSGATVIGEENIAKAIQLAHPGAQTSNPLTACKAALHALDLKRIAFLTPYSPDVTLALQEHLLGCGFEIAITGSFFQSDDFIVGRISPETILRSIEEIGAHEDCDGVFISCTSLRTAAIIETAESKLGKPVTSSNHALAWHLLRLAGIQDHFEGFGRLYQKQLHV
jgi:maleate isomerase